MKYIIVDEIEPIIFPESITHDKMANKFNQPITSAGFLQIYEDNGRVKYNCYGESVSLKLKSKIEDTDLIVRCFNGY